ncbi:MAG: SMC-Scp complex subunit ScpB [Nitrosomonas halophila]|jgi:segregation and condensation protein B
MSTLSTLTQPVEIDAAFKPDDILRILETALLTAQEPLSMSDLGRLFDGQINHKALHAALTDLRTKWHDSGLELTQVASGWRFQSKPEMQIYLDRLTPHRPPRYSRAAMETLAIIAYRQPVTRGDIEAIRGVVVAGSIIKALEARGWIETVGQRDVPGRPFLYATTQHFLNDLNLQSLEQLPPLEDLDSLSIVADKLERVDGEATTAQENNPSHSNNKSL